MMKEVLKKILEIIEKRDVVRYVVLGIICLVLVGVLFVIRGGTTGFITGFAVYEGPYWDKIDNGGGSYNLKIYNSIVNYYNGTDYVPITYGSCGSNCFRDWNGFIYKISTDLDQAYINLYDVNDNLISNFGFGITGTVGGTNYKYTTLNFTWTWDQEYDVTNNEYIFRAWNNRVDFNWTQEFHFYPNQSMKIKNIIKNNLGADIQNTKFWYIQTVGADDGIWFNGTKYNIDTYKSGDFDSLIPKIKFEDYYIFDYNDLLNNSFNVTDFYLGDGDIIGVGGVRILAIGITKGNGIFPDGIGVTVDPTIKISGGNDGGDVYVDKSTANGNHGDKDYLKVQRFTWQRVYLKFNISAIPVGQIIDNASLCLFLDNDQGAQNISINHVYNDSWCEGDGGTDGSPSCEMTWNNQACGIADESLDGVNCNTTIEDVLENDGNLDYTWQCWNILNMIKTDYTVSDELLSMILWTTDVGSADVFHSKEYSNLSLIPYLNITYHTANVAPIINIDFPLNNGIYGYNESLDLNFSVFDNEGNLDSCWYNLDDGINVSLVSCLNTTFNVAGDGSYVLNIYTNDSLGEESSDSVNFSVQTGAPTIVLFFPKGYLDYGENINFNYTPTDVDLDSCELWGDFDGSFSLNQTNTNPINNSINTFYLSLSDSGYLWNVRCNDSIGNFAFNGNQTFYVDTINPSVSVSEPTGAKTSRTISSTWSVSDSNLESCRYNVYQGASLEVANTSVTCSDNSTSFDVSSDADFVFNFYVNDSAGNKNSTNLSFSVDTSSSIPTPPSSEGSSGGGGGGGYFPNEITGKMQVTQLGEIIAYEGDEKSLSLNVKNVGSKFLNNCRLIAKGDISSWIYSDKIEGIALGENIDFNFNLNVPEEIGSGDYLGELEINCDEGIDKQNITVIIPGLEIIEVKEIIQEKDELTVNYVLKDKTLIGKEISIEIWLVDRDNVEVTRITDSFLVEESGERMILMNLPGNLAGVYSIYFALSSDLESFVRKSVVLGKSRTVGMVVLESVKSKMIVYVLFLLILGVGVFFIWRRHKEDSPHTSKAKNNWLLKKKGFFRG